MKTILLAVSGGKDSISMADMCCRRIHFSADEGGVFDDASFVVAHCNFHLRAAESDADAAFVEAWAEEHGLECHRADFDTAIYASDKGLSIEMAARELRYDWFASLCEEFGYDGVAVAHNANDNAETMILNLVRGTGLKGVCGMSFSSLLPVSGKTVPLYRPLIDLPRSVIEEYVSVQGLAFRTDSTNADSKYKRNLIRNKIFPLFEELNPSFLESFGRDMRHFSQAEKLLDSWMDEQLSSVLTSQDKGCSISLAALKALEHWPYLLYRILDQYGFNESVSESLVRLLSSEEITRSGKVFRNKHCRLLTSRDRIDILLTPETESESQLLIESDGEYCFNGVKFRVETRLLSPGQDFKCPAGTLVCDASKLPFPLLCRCWRDGDWFVPFGMKGRKKLSDFFTDIHLTREEKSSALILTRHDESDGRVSAVLGRRMDDSLKAGMDTQRLIYFIVIS